MPEYIFGREFDQFKVELSVMVSKFKTIDEIKEWINSYPLITSVEVDGRLLKSNPPQRSIIIGIRMGKDHICSKLITIFELPSKGFVLNKVLDI